MDLGDMGLTANTSASQAQEALVSLLKADAPLGRNVVAGTPVLAARVNNETLARCVAVTVRVGGQEVKRWDRVCGSSSRVSLGKYIPATCLEPWIYPKWQSGPTKGDSSKLNRFGTLQIDVRNCQPQNELKDVDDGGDSSNIGSSRGSNTVAARSPAVLAAGMNEVAGPGAGAAPGASAPFPSYLGRRLLLRG
jgi:hypothetical protein